MVNANKGVQEIQTKDGKIVLDLGRKKSGPTAWLRQTFRREREEKLSEFDFGPEPDYVLRAPWASNERTYSFPKGNGVLHISVPAKNTKVSLVPKALMLEIPNGTAPGTVLWFKHPAPVAPAGFGSWFTTTLPKNWQAKKHYYLPVRLQEEYQYEQGSGGNFCQDLLQQMSHLIERLCEDLDRIWLWLQQCC
eukprot:Skav225450  [mRNA]  locus=scaffold3785:23558:24133:- [translate_table: standard]